MPAKFEPVVTMFGITDGRSVYIPASAKEVRRYLKDKGLAYKQKRSLLQGTASIQLREYNISFYLRARIESMSKCHQSPWPTQKATPEENNRVFKMIRTDLGASNAAFKERRAALNGKSTEPLLLRVFWVFAMPPYWVWLILVEGVPELWRSIRGKLRRARRRRRLGL